jgi:hypothetical protein
MSILDDAIREHLELKRAHGADTAELKKLEDEAFGPPARPDELGDFAEAPTAFLGDAVEEKPDGEAEPSGRRLPNIADLQEAPEAPKPEADVPEPEPQADVPPTPEPASHSTEERQAIAEQPTELFDVEAESGPEASGPSDEELIDAEMSEPRLAPVDPLAGVDAASPEPEVAEQPAAEEEEEDDFFSEQRLSDELSQALDAPITDEHEVEAEEQAVEAEEPEADEHGADEGDEQAVEEYEEDDEPAAGADHHHDALEDTPDFLEDAPEDDDLWFEQRPPKDFDFDD